MYDAIVVGARCAGSPTAMLLARQGHRVLLVDRASFPSDTLSTHYIHQSGVACLECWGLLPQIERSGCPPIRDYTLDIGPFGLTGTPPPAAAVEAAYSPRRAVLDEILVQAAAAAGAEVREGFAVEELVTEGERGRRHPRSLARRRRGDREEPDRRRRGRTELARGAPRRRPGLRRVAGAIDAGFSGRQSLELALARYERRRNELAGPSFASTVEFARLQPPPAEMQQLLAALLADQEQANRFFGTFAGTVPIPEFFAPANIARIVGREDDARAAIA